MTTASTAVRQTTATARQAEEGRLARIRLLYQLPIIVRHPSVLLVGDPDPDLAPGWPGPVSRCALDDLAPSAGLESEPRFDVVAVVGLLGADRKVTSGEPDATVVTRLSRRLSPGGVLIGDVNLAPLSMRTATAGRPGQLAGTQFAAGLRGARHLHAALARAGLVQVESYFVRPSIDDPMVLIPTHARAASAYFTRQLDSARSQLGGVGFALRRVLIASGLGALNQRTLLFWARRPC